MQKLTLLGWNEPGFVVGIAGLRYAGAPHFDFTLKNRNERGRQTNKQEERE